MSVLVAGFERLGASVLAALEELGRTARMAGLAAANLFQRPVRWRETIRQVQFIGIQSLPIILLCSLFTGAVFTWESHEAFALFGAQGLVGGTVGVAITRELAPTLTGLLVAGRAGSAMAAEIGSMRVSEQIDALEAMAVDPVNYLVKPRVVAATLAMPLLTAIFDFVGILGSYVVAIYLLHMNYPEFMVRLVDWVDWDDIAAGLVKSTCFGLIIGVVACTKGFYTAGGAVGVGRSTTSSVVVASVAILVSNYFIAVMLP
jgi:phospholipid/cholesterol/gamma-HCH transport system permease protein